MLSEPLQWARNCCRHLGWISDPKRQNLCPHGVYMVMDLDSVVVIQTLDSGPRISCLSLGLTRKEFRTEGFRLNNHSLSSEGTSLRDVIGASECLREGVFPV